MKQSKRIAALLVAALLLFTVFTFPAGAAGPKLSGLKLNDHIEFGWYPQSRVTDEALIDKLNNAGGEWISYGYYSGTGKADGSMKPGDFMKYKDVLLDGGKYRAVTFSQYRPFNVKDAGTDQTSNQLTNGYSVDQVYWFRYDPIVWRVLDPEKGLVLAETLLDAQAYHNTIFEKDKVFYQDETCTYYANNYRESSIRKWLNDDFLRTAFSAAQLVKIQTTEVKFDGHHYNKVSKYGSGSGEDKIFLLAYNDREASNRNYGFYWGDSNRDDARVAGGSDYAKCQGLFVFDIWNTKDIRYGKSPWILRSSGNESNYCSMVAVDGMTLATFEVSYTYGVRPACLLDPNAQIDQCRVDEVGTAKAAPAGDVDGDGTLSSADARLSLRASVGLEKYKEGSPQFIAADADKDGKITSEDARLILRASVGLETLA